MIQELSENFSWAEASITSHREFDNEIPAHLYHVIKNTALWMEKVRNVLNDKPISVSSWYRSPALNTAIGSDTNTSEHPRGQAVDFICPKFGTPIDIVRALSHKDSGIYFNQLILEHTWVHISFPVPPAVPKMQVLTLLANKRYAVGITDKYGKPV